MKHTIVNSKKKKKIREINETYEKYKPWEGRSLRRKTFISGLKGSKGTSLLFNTVSEVVSHEDVH